MSDLSIVVLGLQKDTSFAGFSFEQLMDIDDILNNNCLGYDKAFIAYGDRDGSTCFMSDSFKDLVQQILDASLYSDEVFVNGTPIYIRDLVKLFPFVAPVGAVYAEGVYTIIDIRQVPITLYDPNVDSEDHMSFDDDIPF